MQELQTNSLKALDDVVQPYKDLSLLLTDKEVAETVSDLVTSIKILVDKADEVLETRSTPEVRTETTSELGQKL